MWAILLFTEEKTCDFDLLIRSAGQGAGQGVPHTGLLIYSGTVQLWAGMKSEPVVHS